MMQEKYIEKVYTMDTDDVGEFLLGIRNADFDVNDDIYPAEVTVTAHSIDEFRILEVAAQKRGIAYKSTLYSGGRNE
jgi:hypothetical protein